MTAQLLRPTIPTAEQRFLLPARYTWEQFEAIEALLSLEGDIRLTYLDGWIELMTLGEPHEQISRLFTIFLTLYLFAKNIPFIPVGSATRRSRDKKVSFEPDESYYIGERKEHPDLAIEVIFTSGDIDKLEKYKRFQIREVWFWQESQLAVYALRPATDAEAIAYEQVAQSELLPDLDLDLLVRCVQMPDILAARQIFLNGIAGG